MNAPTDPTHQPTHSAERAFQKGDFQKRASRKTVGLAIAYAAFFCITLWAAYNNRLPLAWLSQFPHYDKVGHVVLYAIPTYLGHRVFNCKHVHFLAQRLALFPVLFTLFTLTEELVQGFSPYRTLDMGDMLCSLLGIGLGYWLAQRYGGQFAQPPSNR